MERQVQSRETHTSGLDKGQGARADGGSIGVSHVVGTLRTSATSRRRRYRLDQLTQSPCRDEEEDGTDSKEPIEVVHGFSHRVGRYWVLRELRESTLAERERRCESSTTG